MDETLQGPEPKISVVVGILGLIVAAVMDLLSLIPFVGDIEDIPAGAIFMLNLVLGVGPVIMIAQGIAMVLKLIPVVQEFPSWTAAWIVAWYIDSHPSVLGEKVKQAAALADSLETGGAEGELEGGVAEAESGMANTQNTETASGASATDSRAGGGTRETQAASGEKEAGSNTKSEDEQKKQNLEEELEGPAQRSPEKEAEEKDFGINNDMNGGGGREEERDEASADVPQKDEKVINFRERWEKMQKRQQVHDISAPSVGNQQNQSGEDDEIPPEGRGVAA